MKVYEHKLKVGKTKTVVMSEKQIEESIKNGYSINKENMVECKHLFETTCVKSCDRTKFAEPGKKVIKGNRYKIYAISDLDGRYYLIDESGDIGIFKAKYFGTIRRVIKF